ncbi:MAG: multiheme cytochrome-associated LysR family transcriptional regulator [Desulfuromonadales bacterium]
MQSTYLKTLIEVARTGNLTRAADTLCVTQSAVSRRIKFLEDQYGQALIDRSGPVLTMTAAGYVVLEKAELILELEQELLSKLIGLEKKQPFTFACTPAFGIVHLPNILREFMLSQAETGDLKFVLDMPEKIVEGLRKGMYEMAVIEHCQCFDLSDFDKVALQGDEMVFAAAPGLGISSPANIDQLFQQTLYGRHEGCCSRTLLNNNLHAMGRTIEEFRRIVVYDNLHVIVQALLNGDGIAFISSDIVKSYVDAGTLTTCRVEGFVHQRKRTFLFNGRLPGMSLAEKFAENLLRHFDAQLQVAPGLSCGG